MLIVFLLLSGGVFGQHDDLEKFEKAIRKFGTEPMDYVTNRLEKSDLLVFDDGFHSALEPFKFYEDMDGHMKATSICSRSFGISDKPHHRNQFWHQAHIPKRVQVSQMLLPYAIGTFPIKKGHAIWILIPVQWPY